MQDTTPTPVVRATQTATTADGLVHAFIVINGKSRCSTEAALTRSSRQPRSAVTCPACQAELARPVIKF